MPPLSFHDKQHVLRLLSQQGQVKRIFDEFTRRSGLILTKWTEKSTDNVWVRNATLEKQIDRLLEELHDKLLLNINNNTTGAWEASNLKNDDLLNAFIKDMALPEIIGKSRFEELEKGMFARNMDALRAFQQRKVNGMDVSGLVWQSVEGAKENLEYYLSSGIATGRPAVSIAQDVRQLLHDPDKRFRRIRNEEGKLILSKPMQEYHPGQGRYRSSYMNALRVAATETNMSYHTADHERWKNQGFVLGIEVSRSRSNKGPCDICDPMVGRYPKGYKFNGNHPWCICQAVPIMLEGEEYIDYLLTGNIPEDKIIKTVPQSAINFVNDKEANRRQLFVRENEKYFHAEKAGRPNISDKKILQTAYPDISGKIINVENIIRKNTEFETGVAFNKDGNVVVDKRGESTSVAFTNDECRMVKDCIFTHNHPRAWTTKEGTIGRIGSSFSKEDIRFAVVNDVVEIRAVTPTYTFSLKRPEKGWNISADKLSKLFEKYNSELISSNMKVIRKSNWDDSVVGRANVSHFHILWKRISKEQNWEYTKKKTI